MKSFLNFNPNYLLVRLIAFRIMHECKFATRQRVNGMKYRGTGNKTWNINYLRRD